MSSPCTHNLLVTVAKLPAAIKLPLPLDWHSHRTPSTMSLIVPYNPSQHDYTPPFIHHLLQVGPPMQAVVVSTIWPRSTTIPVIHASMAPLCAELLNCSNSSPIFLCVFCYVRLIYLFIFNLNWFHLGYFLLILCALCLSFVWKVVFFNLLDQSLLVCNFV